ncbi:MAG: phosphatase PAP2 family protein [Pseudomonadota bacterium]
MKPNILFPQQIDILPDDLLKSQKTWKWNKIRPWITLISGFIIITLSVYAFSFLINDKLDWSILLYLNPDVAIPVVDDLMILITDFSIPLFGLALLSHQITCLALRTDRIAKKGVMKCLKIMGLIFSLMTCSAYFWAGYEHRLIFFPLAFILFGAFLLLSERMNHYTGETIRQFNGLFWITLLSTFLTELSVEKIIKELVTHARPLSDVYAAYNIGLRTVADEVVRGGYSYVAGQSAILFAMITPLIWFTPNRWFKAGLFAWGLFHAFTRVYLAAHFPYDSLMGAILGFSMATVAVKAFRVLENKEEAPAGD